MTVAATATLIVDGGAGSGPAGRYWVENIGSVNVFLGGAAVAASGGSVGKRLQAGQSASFQLARGDTLYGIVASGTCDVDYLRLDP